MFPLDCWSTSPDTKNVVRPLRLRQRSTSLRIYDVPVGVLAQTKQAVKVPLEGGAIENNEW